MPQAQRTAAEIMTYLDEIFEVEYSYRNTEAAANELAKLDAVLQTYVLDWAKRISTTNIELAFQFSNLVSTLLENTNRNTIEAWALHAMDVYDRQGLHQAMEVMCKIDEFARHSHELTVGAVFEDEVAVLLPFVQGLSGRKLKLEKSETIHTDSETIFLPGIMAQLPEPEDNFRLYKVTVTYLWAQCRFGTFRVDLHALLENHDQPEAFQKLFHALDSLRLEACIQRELPGLYRDLRELRHKLETPALEEEWLHLKQHLADKDATAEDVLRLCYEHFGKLQPPATDYFYGELKAEKVAACMQARIEKEKAQLRVALRNIIDEMQAEENDAHKHANKPELLKFDLHKKPAPDQPEGFQVELSLQDQPVAPPESVKSLITSIVQDLGDIPDEYLVAAGDGEYDPKLFHDKQRDPDDVWSGTYHEEGAHIYKEWDYRRQHYRKNWCAVREKTITPVYDTFVYDTLHKYQGLIKHLRKTFEAMRDEDRLMKRQVHGDGIDIDALVEALADARDGSELSERLFTQMHRNDRNIAVVFMVDMSGSTKGWINDAERESLLLLCESLESLNDRYAIYGFSGMTRKRCEIFRIKEIDEPYNEEVRARITGISPQDYTRMGFAIRHLSKILNEVEAKTRILITLSDGKPDDYDGYRGDYGIEDTRRALVEARRGGIHPYCITIDKEARDYLPHMYGPAAFTVLDEVSALPLKVSDIYRRLTT